MNYKGVSCPVCGKEFQEGDDIVVCPECGAPHHRACYKELGHCAMQQLHEQGLAWKNPNEPEKTGADEDIICPNCGLFCKAKDEFCPNCRFPLKNHAPEQHHGQQVVENPFEGQPSADAELNHMFEAIYEEDRIDGVPAKDFISIVRQNYSYFLRVFKIFSQKAKAKVFNWAAFFFNFFYFFYRKMYKIGFILLGVYLLSNIPALILSYHMVQQAVADPMLMSSLQFDFTGLEGLLIISQLCMYARFGVSVYCGFTANRHYYKHCKEKIRKLNVVSSGSGQIEYQRTLSSLGGTNLMSVFLIIALLIGLMLIASTVLVLMM